MCVCAADPWAHGFCGGCCVCVCVQLTHGPMGSMVAVVCVCVCVFVQLTHGPRMVLWWLLCVCVCVQLTHGPTGSVVVVVSACVQLTHGPTCSCETSNKSWAHAARVPETILEVFCLHVTFQQIMEA